MRAPMHGETTISFEERLLDNCLHDEFSHHSDVEVANFIKSNAMLTPTDISTFNAQYPQLEVFYTDSYHDRYLLIGGSSGYLIGASPKDAGKRSFAITKLLEDVFITSLQDELNRISYEA